MPADAEPLPVLLVISLESASPRVLSLSQEPTMPSDPNPLEPWHIPEQEWVPIPVEPNPSEPDEWLSTPC